uniref:Uncharacterized protein n=1 Tax=viral metagenome TaxID=1070528 RepID=A0A6M3LE26_9ZZZZ
MTYYVTIKASGGFVTSATSKDDLEKRLSDLAVTLSAVWKNGGKAKPAYVGDMEVSFDVQED